MANNSRFYKGKKRKAEDNYCPPYSPEILSQSIDVLKLHDEISEKLKFAKIETLLDVLKLDERALLHVNKFNKKNLFVLLKALDAKKLALKPTEVQLDTAKTNNLQSNDDRKSQNRGNTKDDKSGRFSQNRQKQAPKTVILTEAQERAEREKNRPKAKAVELEKDIYLKVNKNGKFGFEDRFGNEVIACVYDETFNFKEEICCVMQDEKYGYIDREGHVIIPLDYDLGASFSEGYACVFLGEKCGYIDKENNKITKFMFEAGTAVENNECRVKKDSKWGELHMDEPNDVRWII